MVIVLKLLLIAALDAWLFYLQQDYFPIMFFLDLNSIKFYQEI